MVMEHILIMVEQPMVKSSWLMISHLIKFFQTKLFN